MKTILLIMVVAVLGLTSCSTVKKTSATAAVETAVVQYPVVADLDIQPKITRTASWGFSLWGGLSTKERIRNLIADMVEESNADILLEPQIKTTRTFMNLGGGSVTITGYPASFKDFRKASEADLDALQKADPRLYNLSKKKK